MDKEKNTTEIVDEVNAAETSAQAEAAETIDEAAVTEIADGENAAATDGKMPAAAKKTGSKKASKIIYWALIAIFATVFVFSGITVLDYFFGENGTVEHNQMMDDLRDQHQRPSGIVRPTNHITPTTTLPADPTNPDEPTVPTDPTDPSNPTVPSDPTQPSDPTVPSDPTQPVNPTDPQPTEPKPTEPTTPPTEPPKPTEPQPTEPKPTEPKPTEPTTPPTEPPKPTVPTKPPHVNTTILSEMKPIYDKNKDTVGWIQIPGTNIDYPVMQTKQNPDYYIDKNFYKKDDDHGTIYANAISDVFTPSDVITLYGHHMADGTMFKDIYYYTTESYFNSHPYVYFDSLYTRRTYQVVLLFRTNGEPHSYYPFFPFHTYSNFRNETEFNYFMSSIRKLKLHESNVEVNYGDKLLCLVTCDYMPYPNGRLVLVCKQIQ